MSEELPLSRRERQIMDIVYRHREVAVSDVLDELPDPPSYSAVRALMRVLEDKGHLQHRQDGPRYLYRATVPRTQARERALKRVLDTFFEGSTEKAVAALLDRTAGSLEAEELERLSALIERARREGR
ncbi:MAG: BlaI/MecI/CopY family transcriptional regulator [Gemmatimonadota bacterium]